MSSETSTASVDTAKTNPQGAPRTYPRTRGARTGAWLLALSPAYFVGVILTGALVLFPHDVPVFTEITRPTMDALGIGWVVFSAAFPVAAILGSIGMILTAAALRTTPRARPWALTSIGLSAIAVVGLIPVPITRALSMGFTEATLGDNVWFSVWDIPLIIAVCAAIAAVVILCVALNRARIRPTAALVIGGLSTVYLIATAAALPLPPFVIAFLWTALGMALLTAPRNSELRRTGTIPAS